jgi:hypothetical protein
MCSAVGQPLNGHNPGGFFDLSAFIRRAPGPVRGRAAAHHATCDNPEGVARESFHETVVVDREFAGDEGDDELRHTADREQRAGRVEADLAGLLVAGASEPIKVVREDELCAGTTEFFGGRNNQLELYSTNVEVEGRQTPRGGQSHPAQPAAVTRC